MVQMERSPESSDHAMSATSSRRCAVSISIRTIELKLPGFAVACQIARNSASVSTRSRLTVGATGRLTKGFVAIEPRRIAHWKQARA
jgi:hypothetical protein